MPHFLSRIPNGHHFVQIYQLLDFALEKINKSWKFCWSPYSDRKKWNLIMLSGSKEALKSFLSFIVSAPMWARTIPWLKKDALGLDFYAVRSFEPRTAGWEEQMQPLCYDVP